MNDASSPAEANGRMPSGKFGPGNRFGKGNPLAVKAQQLRVAMLDTVGSDDIEAIIKAMIAAAKGGDIQAGREVLDRTVGKACQTDVLQRIEALENAMLGGHEDAG